VPCRACGRRELEPCYEAAGVPIHANRLAASREAALAAPTGELRLELCPGCGLLQNGAFDAARLEYTADYENSQFFSPHFRAYAAELARGLAARHALRGRSVVEIGCGAGDFLALLCEAGGCRGVGFDPAHVPARAPEPPKAGYPPEAGVRFVRAAWGAGSGPLQADLVCLRHTLEHLAEPRAFLDALRAALSARPGAAVFCEVPDAARVLRDAAFWDLYYEHCSYFTAESLARLFRAAGFEILREGRGFGDQYLLLEARLAPGAAPAAAAGPDLAALAALGRRFGAEAARHRERWRGRLAALGREGPLVLWGGGAKAVGFLAALAPAAAVACAVDVNPHKQRRFLPITGHEVVAPERLRERAPRQVLLLNPAYQEEVGKQLAALGLAPALHCV
jgi:SAM-dependent methyltransferase